VARIGVQKKNTNVMKRHRAPLATSFILYPGPSRRPWHSIASGETARIHSRYEKIRETERAERERERERERGRSKKERAVRASNTRGGACNSKAAPYFNIVPSYIMFQQNGRRTRGSASTMPRRVVYLKHTIPPSPALQSPPSLLHLFPSCSPSSVSWRRGQRQNCREKERERERERERAATTAKRRERKVECLRSRLEREDRRRPSAPTPTVTPFSFSFRVVYIREDGKPATVRELTTFFRFSRRWYGRRVDSESGWIEGKNRKRKAKASHERQSSLAVLDGKKGRGGEPAKGLWQVMMYRGKFPAENYIQIRLADLPRESNRLLLFLARSLELNRRDNVPLHFEAC